MNASNFGGYAAYIIGAYGVFVFVFALQAVGVGLQSRRIRKHLKKQIERQKNEAT